MTRAVILARVSTEEQAEEGTSLSGQIEAGLDRIAQRGYQLERRVGYSSDGIDYVPGVFQEDFTGKIALRPAVKQLLSAIEQYHIQVVVIYNTKRLGRRGAVQ